MFSKKGRILFMNEQILIQDTLKHLAEWEYEELTVSQESIAAEVAITQDQVNLSGEKDWSQRESVARSSAH